ncbi:CoA-binding protein [Tamlana sedimentorum]|uniref:CoA-binding protein n=1 Tax=Neotamlana sedimentorum TaxID=1435349 RepID=A0A0D7W9F9_9FLAO|nr:CoA-binding protein [Tamlana sedimentorum]KJD35775.1 CoA-binding protein [Tamlana sedimentorum]
MKDKTLVFGASLNPDRYSNLAINRLVANNKKVVAYGLRGGTVAGVTIETELVNFNDIDTVALYMNPLRQKPFYNDILSLNPKRVIFNPGTENPEFYSLLQEKNIHFEASCTLVLLSTNQY